MPDFFQVVFAIIILSVKSKTIKVLVNSYGTKTKAFVTLEIFFGTNSNTRLMVCTTVVIFTTFLFVFVFFFAPNVPRHPETVKLIGFSIRKNWSLELSFSLLSKPLPLELEDSIKKNIIWSGLRKLFAWIFLAIVSL